MKVPWAKTEVSEIQEYCEREKKKREIKNGDIKLSFSEVVFFFKYDYSSISLYVPS